MPAFRVVIMLKPGVLDAAGGAVERGLAALGYRVERVRVGKVIEVTAPDATPAAINEMCERFLANPLIESWRIEAVRPNAAGPNAAAQGASASGAPREGASPSGAPRVEAVAASTPAGAITAPAGTPAPADSGEGRG